MRAQGIRDIVSQNSSMAGTTAREGLAKLDGVGKARPKHANVGTRPILQSSRPHATTLDC